MKLPVKLAAGISALMLVTNAHAEGLALGGKVGTLGLGVDLTVRASESLNLRAGVNFLRSASSDNRRTSCMTGR